VTKGNREIERKYLLTALPPHARTAPPVHIDQGYVPGQRINERVRRTERDGALHYYRTIKSGAGIEKLEIEEESDERFFLAVWPLTVGHRIEKLRYAVRDGDVVWEIDEFVDRSGLWFAEVELRAVDQRVVVPAWLAEFVEREVTEDGRYTNYALSK
jgi:CYTH domain-containing protein